MQDKELYRQLLGLQTPWVVSEVAGDFKKLKVDVWVIWPAGKQAACQKCGNLYSIYDHRGELQWRHLDTMEFQTILHCRIPRVNCSEHGVKSIDISQADKRLQFTALFEQLAIDVLLGCQKQTKAKELLRLSWDEAHHIQKRTVQRGLQRRGAVELQHIGEAADKASKRENKILLRQGEESLKRTKYLWLTNPDKWDEKQKGLLRILPIHLP